jgi:hypothetical protein
LRALDAELYKLLYDVTIKIVTREEPHGFLYEEARRTREVWVSESRGTVSSSFNDEGEIHPDFATYGYVDDTGKFVERPHLEEVPFYTTRTEDALSFKSYVSSRGRRMLLEEIDDGYPQVWQARIVDRRGSVLAAAKANHCAKAILAAALNDLIRNKDASWWIEVTD